MKKFLALVLALVMTMSLVTISAGAKDFDDNADITYVEAVDVMSDLKIVDGDLAGNFNPTNGLTRGAAAKIICNLILGPTTAAELNADTNPYPDVDKDSTYAGYIAYCAKEGIISGYADGTFKQANPLTGYAFMKMLLGALGYDAAVEGYTGANWSINVAKQAIGIGLNAGLVESFNGSDFVTREEAMLYAFNTMKATMVDYDTTITIGDITVAGSNEYDVANNAKTEGIKEDNKMQFAEKYFTKLTVKADTDVFERPCNTWVNGKETIGTYVDYTQIVAEYTTAVSGKELYDVIGKTAFENYDFTAYVDGEENDTLCDFIAKNNKASITESGNGALLQVFVNNDTEDVVVTVVNTYLAQATMDYSAKKDSVSFKVYTTDGDYVTYAVSGEDFDIADVKDEDFALVTVADDAIQSVADVEIIADTDIEKFTSGKDGSLTVDGEKYSYSEMAEYDAEVLEQYTKAGNKTNLKDLTYNVYLDAYGYVIGVDLVTTPDNYVFITGADKNSSNLANKTWSANAIFMDGTSAVIDVKNNGAIDDVPVINAWYTYTVSTSDVYTLTLVNDEIAIIGNDDEKAPAVAQAHNDLGDVKEINAKHISLAGIDTDARVYGNDASIYLLAGLDEVDGDVVITEADEVVTGVKNAAFTVYGMKAACAAVDVDYVAGETDATNTSYGVYTLYKENGYVMAAVVVGESDTIASDLAYVISDEVSSESYDKVNKTWTWTRTVVIGGEEVVVTETNDTGLSVLEELDQYTWVTLKYDADGNVKKVADPDTVPDVATAVEAVEDDEELVVMYSEDNDDVVYELKGNTLYDKTNKKLGFLIAEDVKIVLEQEVKNVTTVTYDEGVKTLEGILANLNEDENGAHDYYFDAVIEDGIATVVIIIDGGADDDFVGPNGAVSAIAELITVDALVNAKLLYVTESESFDEDAADALLAAYFEKYGDAAPLYIMDDLAAAIAAELTADGYKVTAWDMDEMTISTIDAEGDAITFTIVMGGLGE